MYALLAVAALLAIAVASSTRESREAVRQSPGFKRMEQISKIGLLIIGAMFAIDYFTKN